MRYVIRGIGAGDAFYEDEGEFLGLVGEILDIRRHNMDGSINCDFKFVTPPLKGTGNLRVFSFVKLFLEEAQLCEYPKCNNQRVCFHYCKEHHKSICRQSIGE